MEVVMHGKPRIFLVYAWINQWSLVMVVSETMFHQITLINHVCYDQTDVENYTKNKPHHSLTNKEVTQGI
jgi:hypothetical protein